MYETTMNEMINMRIAMSLRETEETEQVCFRRKKQMLI